MRSLFGERWGGRPLAGPFVRQMKNLHPPREKEVDWKTERVAGDVAHADLLCGVNWCVWRLVVSNRTEFADGLDLNLSVDDPSHDPADNCTNDTAVQGANQD